MGWLIALAVLLILAWLPLGATIRYNSEGFSLKVIAGPFRIGIVPGKPKEKKEDKPKSKKKQSSPPQKKPAATAAKEQGGPITDFLPILKTVLELLDAFRRKLRINHLQMKLIMAADDPCDLAVNYGKAWAALGNLLPALEKCFVIKKRDLEVECDFEASQTVIIAGVDLTITLGRLLGILVFYGVRALKQFITIQNKRKGGKTV